MVNGTMGIGKTTVSRQLLKNIQNSVWLDGDWCWMMNPFEVTEANKAMVVSNITYQLNNFLDNTSIDYIIFSWVMHKQSIINDILSRLKDDNPFDASIITLMCSEDELIKRISKDINNGIRDVECIKSSISRLDLYKKMDTIKVDTTYKTIEEIIDEIKERVGYKNNTTIGEM